MNPTAIYSKSGKGVQEASGKTSALNRGDRAVLSAIDGRATLADVAQKVGKSFDSAFQDLIAKLDKDGFVREVSPGVAPKTAAPAAKPGAKPAAKSEDSGGDLDFSSLGGGAPKASPAPSRAAPPPPKPAAPPPRPAAPPPPPPPPPKPKVDPNAESQARATQSALQKAREEAEAKADAERQRIKAEAEAKMRAEMEAKARDDATRKAQEEVERKAKEAAEAKVRAAQEAAARAAAEAKAKADAEAKAKIEAERKAREEAERARKAAEEEARKAREEAERARKAAEEEARKAREEAERIRKAAEEEARKAREEAERARKAAEEERKREEAERAARRKKEQEEEAARRKAREEEDRRHEEERAATRRQREEQEQREAEETATRAKKKREDEALMPAAPPPAAAKSDAAGGLDSLMADLDSFTTREEDARKEKEEAERKEKEAAARRAREDEERRAKEEAERTKKEEARARKEEEKRRKREEEEELSAKREKEEKRLRAEEEKRKKEADERERKAKAEEVLTAKATRGPAVAVGEDTDEVRKRMIGRRGAPAAPAGTFQAPSVRHKKSSLGKMVAISLVVLLAAAIGYVHVMPVSVAEYERAASEALGQQVKIGEARITLLGGGVQLALRNIRLGDDVRIVSGTASPDFNSLSGEKKTFSRIDLEGVQLPQEAIGRVLTAKVAGDNFTVDRVVIKKLELTGAAVLPSPLEADLAYARDGVLTSATVRGPDNLLAKITPRQGGVEYVVTASGFPLPVLPELTLSDFGMKGTATQRGMSITEWGGKIYGGGISGTANLRWAGGWAIDGVVTVRNINAAVFAPALVSEGKGEGTGRFSMSGAEPSKLASGGRLEGSFTINSGVLGSFDLGRVIRSSGKEYAGRTQFNELTGQATYDRGAVSLRNVAIGAGALNAGASADISQSGALSGRIVADVKSGSGRALSQTVQLGGTIKEPQVKN